MSSSTNESTDKLNFGKVNVGTTELNYAVIGSGMPCVIIGSPIYYPKIFSKRWQEKFCCYHLEHRGFVADAHSYPERPYRIPEIVADLEIARQQLNLDKFVLMGHSIHGLIALAYACHYPQHVTQVIAINAPPEYTLALTEKSSRYWETGASAERKAQHERNRAKLPAGCLANLSEAATKVISAVTSSASETQVQQESNSVLTDDSLAMSPSDAYIANYIANAALYWHDPTFDATALWEGLELNLPLLDEIFDLTYPYTLPATVNSISIPAFIALGQYDFVIPYTAWENAQTPFANLTIKRFDNSGHTPPFEEAEAFDNAVFTWLKF